MRLRFLIGAEPKSGSSNDRKRGQSPYGWIPTSSNGSKPMAAGTRPKQMGFYATPCFISKEKNILAMLPACDGVRRLDRRSEMHGSCRAKMNSTVTLSAIYSRDSDGASS